MADAKKKKKTVKELEDELKRARSQGRNARERMRAFKEGLEAGLDLSSKARRD